MAPFSEKLAAFKPEPSNWVKRSYWELHTEPSSFATRPGWSNKDMDPTPIDKRTWRSWDYLFLWLSDGLNVGTMQQASAIIALGLSWREALPALAIGNTVIAATIAFNGLAGAKYHVPFPVLSRSAFGFYFSYFAVVSRLVLALIYFGTNSFIGASCTKIMIKSIWPSFTTLPNRIPLSSAVTTQTMIAYLVFWFIQLPFVIIPPRKMKWVFVFKSFVVTVAAFALLGWSINTGGSGKVLAAQSTLKGSDYAWAWVYALNVSISGKTTLAINMPDLARYSTHPRDQWLQLIYIPVAYTVFSMIGITVASASTVIYGTTYWDPTAVIALWPNRAAAFFCSAAFCLAQLGTNISTNSIAATNDLTFLFPKYLNIKRAAWITAILGGWATVPWQIQASGSALTTFLSGYVVVLAPLLAIMITDFWLVKKAKLNLPDLYRSEGIYRYWKGINWRAAVTLLIIIPINLPGLAQKINAKLDIGNMLYMYKFSWINAYFITTFVYLVLSKLFPPRAAMVDVATYDDERIEEVSESYEGKEKSSIGADEGI